MNPPFKPNGIYIRKLDPQKDYEGYKKTTKVVNIWNAVKGTPEKPDYESIWFYKKRLKGRKWHTDDQGNTIFYFNSSLTTGEVFELADWLPTRHWDNTEYEIESYDEESFEIAQDHILIRGTIWADILQLSISNLKTGESLTNKFRFVAGEVNTYMLDL